MQLKSALEALTIIDQRSQEGRGLVETLTVEDEKALRGRNDANTLTERSRRFEMEIDCRRINAEVLSDTGKMGDRHAAACEVVGDDNVLAFNGYPLNLPRPYNPKNAKDTPKDGEYPLPRMTAQSAPNP
jgi:hypothetical protein